jgi:hypothetical protein
MINTEAVITANIVELDDLRTTLWLVVKSHRRIKLDTNHLFEVMESRKYNILLMFVRFSAPMNIKALATCDPRAIKICVNILAVAAIPVVFAMGIMVGKHGTQNC